MRSTPWLLMLRSEGQTLRSNCRVCCSVNVIVTISTVFLIPRPLAQPLITDLIQNLLQLPNRLYQVRFTFPATVSCSLLVRRPWRLNIHLCLQPGVPDYKIVLTPENTNAGYATYVEKLLDLANDMGLQMNFNTEIDKIIEMSTGGFTLSTKDGRVRPFLRHASASV